MYICDTHALIFYMANELPEKLNSVFLDCENQKTVIYIPSIVIAEAIHLKERGKVDFDIDKLFSRLEQSSSYFVIIPLDANILKMLSKIKKIGEIHDKIIVATAILYNSVLITRDSEITESKYVETLWD